jgi:hypothetical protein
MSKRIPIGALALLVALALPLGACTDSERGDEVGTSSEAGRSGTQAGRGEGIARPSGLAAAWTALMAARDAVARDLDSGSLDTIRAMAEPLAKLADALLAQSEGLEAGQRGSVEWAVKQLPGVADALQEAAERGDAAQTRKELKRLDSLLELIRAQYPAGALETASHGSERRFQIAKSAG